MNGWSDWHCKSCNKCSELEYCGDTVLVESRNAGNASKVVKSDALRNMLVVVVLEVAR
jgi:hypothetical protein